MEHSNIKKILLFTGLLLTPYLYYFTIRRRLIKIEEDIDKRITDNHRK